MDEPQSAVVVVPTMNSGRRLRLALTEAVAAANGGSGAFFPPRVMTPETFFRAKGDDVATKAETVIAWASLLRSMPLRELDQFFPQATRERTFSWAMAAAKPLMNACEQVAEADRSVGDIAELSEEPERWVQLAEIERRVAGKLKSMGKVLPAWAKRKVAKDPELPLGCERLIIAGVSDPVRLALRAWQGLAAQVPTEVWVHADDALSEHFDVWGLPDVEYWSEVEIALPSGNEAIAVSGNAGQVAESVVRDFAAVGVSSDQCAVGLCDADFAAAVGESLSRAAWPVFDPNGRSLASLGLMTWLGTMRELLANRPGFDAAEKALKMAETRGLVSEAGTKSLAESLDVLRQEAIPESVDQAIHAAVRGNAEGGRDEVKNKAIVAQMKLRELREAVVALADGNVCGRLAELIAGMVAEGYDDGADGKAAEAVILALDEVAGLLENGVIDHGGDALDLVTELLRGQRLFDDRENAVIDLQGWLELAFEDAPYLALVGVHEGLVPENLNEDAFLPEGLRKRLKLRDRSQRMARDSYLLAALAQCRSGDGSMLKCHIAKQTPTGDGCVPSRLLMRCTDDELAARVKHCFAEIDGDGDRSPAWDRGDWILDFARKNNPYADGTKPLSPSALKRYLSCPLRFYFERVLYMQRSDPKKREMAPNDFGTLVHGVLEKFGSNDGLKDSVDAEEIADFFAEELNAEVERRFGRHLTLPILVQVDSARERLKQFATVQAVERAAGWKIIAVEEGIDGWTLDGMPFKMMIDRIERNENTGHYRVMDFKTSASAKKPRDVHFTKFKQDAREPLGDPLEMGTKGRKSLKAWSDFQLPLYACYVAEKYNGGSMNGVVVAYANLPRAVRDTSIEPWEISDEELASFRQWLAAAVAGVRASRFWPPGELDWSQRNYDEFGSLAPDGFEEALTPEFVAHVNGEGG